ncbi:nucleotidyltransferase family protein [Amycolatopsis sp. EV170708-02-1]|uniref:nucleotidyltransferase family protein n=1 Tax=Amycolatopsis sp. EV170708-02-1 TaxID=2919322 RepID=UPI001F0C059D|nr:nucleotidyltransferase family protein [Amycolatopsis sp. EV170708-02-1]UMP05798.1 nucleotidyltransferase family protein [Amycolatopsis sp. EV170708-02-1]
MFDLADRLPTPWVMIGGQMVILHGLLADRSIPRVTKDIDLLFDVRFTLDAFPRAHEVLKKLGYEVDGISADGKAHRYLHPATGMMVDLLAPDKLGARAAPKLRTPAGRIVSIPGGKTALDDARPLTATYGGRTSTLYLPGLAAALVVKVKALIDEPPKPGMSSRHVSDIAFLASLVEDPDGLFPGDPPATPRFGCSVDPLDDPLHPAWLALGTPHAEDGFNAWEILRETG